MSFLKSNDFLFLQTYLLRKNVITSKSCLYIKENLKFNEKQES